MIKELIVNHRLDFIDSNHYMIQIASKGTIVGNDYNKDEVLVKYSDTQSGTPFGVLLTSVVNMDITKVNYTTDTIIGGRVHVIRSGNAILQFDKRLRLPMSQPIYVDRKNNTLTWKSVGHRVGQLVKRQDKDGLCNAVFSFFNI